MPASSPQTSASFSRGCGEPTHRFLAIYDPILVQDSLPEALRKVPPAYPDIARDAGVDGVVVVAALVCEHGNVVETRVWQSIPRLDDAATDAVMQWRFRPVVVAGEPVSRWVRIPVRFSLH